MNCEEVECDEEECLSVEREETKCETTEREGPEPEEYSPDTVFWSKLTDVKDGTLSGSFDLPDAVKTFRVSVWAVDGSGSYGLHTSYLQVQRLFNTVLEKPLYMRSGETVQCRLILENNRNESIIVTVPALERSIEIEKLQSYRLDFPVSEKSLPYRISASCSVGSEMRPHRVALPVYRGLTYEKCLEVPLQVTDSGDVKQGEVFVELPADTVPGSVRASLDYKKVGVDMFLSGLENMVREPYGCFEQTSSTTFPMVMLLQYLANLPEQTEQLIKIRVEAEEKMKRGIKRLLGYECKSGGFEWFGSDPGHVTLTAYGIWQFMEMNELGDNVDVNVIDRALDWLRKQYNSEKAEFSLAKTGCDSFSRPPQFCSDIYIVFIMTMLQDYDVKYRKIVQEKLESFEKNSAEKADDDYLAAFIALIYLGNSVSYVDYYL